MGTFKDLISEDDLNIIKSIAKYQAPKGPKKVKKEKPAKVELCEEEVEFINEEYLKELANKFNQK